MSRIPITVCIIAKNEEKFIGECLSRLKPYGFEIIVTDTGSTDKTVEIAQKYADKVLHFKWVNDFSKARNFCASHSSNEWILALDCDEHVVSIDVPKLLKSVQDDPVKTGVVRLKNILINIRGEKGFEEVELVRLYNKRFYKFDYPIHEQICSYNIEERKKVMESFPIVAEIIHHGYALDKESSKKKDQRNLELLLKQLESEPDNQYILFQIGQSYYGLEDYEKAMEYYESAYEKELDFEKIYVQVLVFGLAKTYCRLGMHKKALEMMEEVAPKCNSARFVYYHACVLYDNEEYMKAQLLFLKTTMLPDFESIGENKLHCYETIIELYEAMDDQKMADLFKDKLIKYKVEINHVLKA